MTPKWLAALGAGLRLRPKASAGAASNSMRTLQGAEIYEAIRAALSGHAPGDSDGLSNAAYHGCVRIIAGAVATQPVHVLSRDANGNSVKRDDHPVARLLRDRPNAIMKPGVFRRLVVAHKLHYGNHYSLKVRSPRTRELTDLLPFDPRRMQVIRNTDGSVTYRYQHAQGFRDYAPADVFHVMGQTLDGISGHSVLSFARLTLQESDAARGNGISMFANHLHTAGVLSHPLVLGPEGRANIQASIDEYKAGGAQEGKSLILEEGLQFSTNNINPVDAQWMEARRMSRVEIAMYFGVPPFMLGDTEMTTSWGSGIEQQSIGFVNYTLMDHIIDVQDAVDRDLLGAEPRGLFCQIDPRGLLRGDTSSRWSAHQIARNIGVASSNDIARLEDLPTHEGGDDDYLIPSGARLRSEADATPTNPDPTSGELP